MTQDLECTAEIGRRATVRFRAFVDRGAGGPGTMTGDALAAQSDLVEIDWGPVDREAERKERAR